MSVLFFMVQWIDSSGLLNPRGFRRIAKLPVASLPPKMAQRCAQASVCKRMRSRRQEAAFVTRNNPRWVLTGRRGCRPLQRREVITALYSNLSLGPVVARVSRFFTILELFFFCRFSKNLLKMGLTKFYPRKGC